jgi:hypothetical protein
MDITLQDLVELKKLEQGLWTAEFRFDRAWMEAVLAEDFIEFGRSGRIYSRQQCLDVPEDAIDIVMPLPNFEIRPLGADIVQITYTSIVTYGDEVERANRSAIWLKTTGGWKLKFHQGTPTLR